MKVRVPLEDLRREETAPGAARGGADRASGAALLPAVRREAVSGLPAAVPSSIHLRGMTVDEAILALDKYLDEAAVAGLPFVTVIHGKGTGTLRRALQDFVRHHPHVASFRLGREGEGGSGATIVTLAER